MAKKWSEVVQSDYFKKASPEVQREIRDDYYYEVVEPQAKTAEYDLDAVRSDFLKDTDQTLSTETSRSIDSTLQDVSTELRNQGARGNLNTPVQPEKPKEDLAAIYQRANRPSTGYAAIDSEIDKRAKAVDDKLTRDNQDKAIAAIKSNPEKYKGKTVDEVALDIGNKDAVATGVQGALALATLPIGGAAGMATGTALKGVAGLADVALTQGAIGGGIQAAGDAIRDEATVDRTTSAAGQDALITGAAHVALPRIARLAGGAASSIKGLLSGASDEVKAAKETIKTVKSENAANLDLAKASNDVDTVDATIASNKNRLDAAKDNLKEVQQSEKEAKKYAKRVQKDVAETIYQGGNKDRQEIVQRAIRDEEGNSILTPRQVLTENGVGNHLIRSNEERLAGTGKAGDLTEAYRTQESGQSFKRAVDEADKISGVKGVLQDSLQNMADVVGRNANDLYTNAKNEAQGILNSVKGNNLTMKFPKTRTSTDTIIKDDIAGQISKTAKADIKRLNQTKFKSIDDIDQWKRALAESSREAYSAGRMADKRLYDDALKSFKSEVDDTIKAINPDAAKLYKKADTNYRDIADDYRNKRSVLTKSLKNLNSDQVADRLVTGRYSDFMTDEIVDAVNKGQTSVTRNADLTNMDDLLKSAQALDAGRDVGIGLGGAARDAALRRAQNGEDFSTKQFYRTLENAQGSTRRGDTLANNLVPGAANQSQMNEALSQIARMYDNTRLRSEKLKLTDNLLLPAVADIAATGGWLTGGRVVYNALRKTGIIDDIYGSTAKGARITEFLSNPENAGRILEQMEKRSIPIDTENLVKYTEQVVNTGIRANTNEPERPRQQREEVQEQPVQEEVISTETIETPQGALISERNEALYEGFVNAETGGLKDPWIRTQAKDSSTDRESSAYGPAQMTYTLVQDMVKRHPEMFTDEELEYAQDFIAQGRLMVKRPNDPIYGYGKPGVLGRSELGKQLYANIAKKIINQLDTEVNGDYNALVKRWRGLHDPKYLAKVSAGVNGYLDTRNA